MITLNAQFTKKLLILNPRPALGWAAKLGGWEPTRNKQALFPNWLNLARPTKARRVRTACGDVASLRKTKKETLGSRPLADEEGTVRTDAIVSRTVVVFDDIKDSDESRRRVRM